MCPAHAAAPEWFRVIRMAHCMHISNLLVLAHFPSFVGCPGILDGDAYPSLMRHAQLRPFTEAQRRSFHGELICLSAHGGAEFRCRSSTRSCLF